MANLSLLIHLLSSALYFSITLLQILLLWSPESIFFNKDLFFSSFYFISIPSLTIILLSGIYLIVQKEYRVKSEHWLKQKSVIIMLILLLLIVFLLPSVRQLIQFQSNGLKDAFFSPFLIIKIILTLIAVLLILSYHFSLQHRAKLIRKK